MPTFEYQAQGADGRISSGVLFGTSMDAAVKELSAKGLQIQKIGISTSAGDPLAMQMAAVPAAMAQVATPPVAVQERPRSENPVMGEAENPNYVYEASVLSPVDVTEGPPIGQRSYMETSIWGPMVGKVGLPALLFFFRQGATMFEAGVPIVQALETLSGQSQSPKLRGIIQELAGHVKAGRPISAGLQRYPEVFSSVIVSLIRASEQGGFLDEGMAMVADYLEKEIELRNLYKRVTFYPKLQVIVSIIIIVAANIAIDYFGGTEKLESPLTHVSTWFILTPIIIGLFLFFRVGLANPRIKYTWDSITSRVPYLGKTIRQLNMAKFGRAFGALYKGGVPMQKALTLAADACGNEFLRARMYTAYKGLEGGRGVTETFKSTQAFSPIVISMVHTGEQTGNLDQMLNKVADYYEDEAGTRAVKTGQMTGVILGLIVAIYIGYIVINFYMSHYGGMMNEANSS